MAGSQPQLNRFERLLFTAALVLGGVVMIIRITSAILIPYLHR